MSTGGGMKDVTGPAGVVLSALVWIFVAGLQQGDAQQPAPSDSPRMERYKNYFANMEPDVSVYDPASPWLYDGKDVWFRRVSQMVNIREFLDLNQFHRTEVELGDLRVATVYRELRRVEGSMTSRLHGRITFVHLKKADGTWSLWHDHTAEVPAEFKYRF
jgi:ketosteroid isomerase-like protein